MQTDLTNPATNDSERGQVSTSAAEIYDRFFLPALFARCAAPVAEAAGIAAGDRVLDVACGTGVLALEASRRGAAVTGLDRNAGMLAVARTKAGGIDWVEGMAESLPMRDATFDAVVSQFGLMFFEDRVGALREMRRVLKPGGRMAVAVWAALRDTPGYSAMVELLDRLFGADTASALNAPYCLGDANALRALFAEAGMADARIVRHDSVAEFPSIAEWVHTDIRGWTLADAIDDAQYAQLRREAQTALAAFAGENGTVRFAHPALIVTAGK
jgi:SAM-dependent methyltransferase